MSDTDTRDNTGGNLPQANPDTTEAAVPQSNTDGIERPEPEGAVVGQTPTTETEDADEDRAGDEGDSFPRPYVEGLRRENAKYRERARSADTYAHRLHTELVRATGKLADPTDVPFDESHLDDPDALAAAVDELLAKKPHLASRRPTGEIGQGASPPAASSVDLAALLRQRAR